MENLNNTEFPLKVINDSNPTEQVEVRAMFNENRKLCLLLNRDKINNIEKIAVEETNQGWFVSNEADCESANVFGKFQFRNDQMKVFELGYIIICDGSNKSFAIRRYNVFKDTHGNDLVDIDYITEIKN